jgi:hypothetical protein
VPLYSTLGERSIDVYLSGDAYTTPVVFGPNGDNIAMYGTPLTPGITGRGIMGEGGEPVFTVTYETYATGGPALVDFYSDPRSAPVSSLSNLAGTDHLLHMDAQMRDFDGDGYVEIGTFVTTFTDTVPIDFDHRVAVFGGTDLEVRYDAQWGSGGIARGPAWDFNLDGIPEIQSIHYGTTQGDTPWLSLDSGPDWATPVLYLTGAYDSDILIYGLAR